MTTGLKIGKLAVGRDRATAAFRILQEALTNVARHAEASRVHVGLELRHEQLILNVTDDGKGIPEEALASTESLGLTGMRERAGAFGGSVIVSPIPGGGTDVTVTIPQGVDLSAPDRPVKNTVTART